MDHIGSSTEFSIYTIKTYTFIRCILNEFRCWIRMPLLCYKDVQNIHIRQTEYPPQHLQNGYSPYFHAEILLNFIITGHDHTPFIFLSTGPSDTPLHSGTERPQLGAEASASCRCEPGCTAQWWRHTTLDSGPDGPRSRCQDTAPQWRRSGCCTMCK